MSTEAGKLVSVDPRRLRLLETPALSGVLLGACCRACKACLFGQHPFCQRCNSSEVETVELSSSGRLYSFTIVHRPPSGWTGPAPYALAEVELPEGPHVLAAMVDCRLDRLRVGMGVTLALEVGGLDADGNQLVVYRWRPAQIDEGKEVEKG